MKCRHKILVPTENLSTKKNMACIMPATYVGSTSDIIAPSSLIVTYPPLARAATHTSNDNQKNHEMPIRGSLRHLFFRPNKVSCLIVVFSVLAALTHRRPSSAYPSAEEKMAWSYQGGQRWRSSAAAAVKGMSSACHYHMCAYKFDLTPLTFLLGRRSTA